MSEPTAHQVRGDEYAALYQGSAIPTLTIDHHRRQIIDLNLAAVRLLGLDRSLILGRPGTDFLLTVAPERLARIRAVPGNETASLVNVPTPLGPRTAEVTIVASGLEGVVFVQLTDLTDVLKVATQAEGVSDELVRTSAALQSIASRLAHDLRGPMMSISGFANLLVNPDMALSDEERSNLLERIRANTTALADMTDSILGDADSGPARPQDDSRAPEDLFSVVRGITEAQLGEAGGSLDTSAAMTTLPVSVGVIRQALVNLVSNSIKFRDPSRPLLIEIDVVASAEGTEISVRDNGLGLPDGAEDLFQVGARGASSVGTAGAGLGLAFVSAAVHSLGGSVRGAALDHGACFVISLPDAAPEQPPTTNPSPAIPPLTGAQLQLIVTSAPVATFVIDIAARQIVNVNRAGAALLGLDPTEILGRPGSDFLDAQDIADALRRRVLDEPDAEHAIHTNFRTARGNVPGRIWISVVDDTALAVAQVVPDEPSPTT